MAVALPFLYLLVALNAVLVANHAIIRALRTATDKRRHQGIASRNRPPFGIPTLQVVLDKLRERTQFDDLPNFVKNIHYVFGWFMALVFDIMRRTEETAKTFPQFRELPFSVGRWSTAFLIVGLVLVLSDDVLRRTVGFQFFNVTSAPDFCTQDDFDTKMAQFEQEMNDMTRLPISRQQHNHTRSFHAALVADTALYGVEPFQCETRESGLSGYKADWDPYSKNGPYFFPGFCESALDAAIQTAKSATCTRQECVCLSKKMFAGNITCCWCGKLCIDVPFACPEHSEEEEAELQNYRVAQLERAEEQRLAMLNETSPIYQEELQNLGTETAEKILWQIDVAGTLYALYSAISLFFPSPLSVFRRPMSVIVKRCLFGVDKTTFILFVLAVWWGAEYLHHVVLSVDFRLYVHNIFRDPCLLDADFILGRHQIISDICEELVPMQPEFDASALTIQHVLEEVQFFVNSCDCNFPNQNLAQFQSPEYVSSVNLTQIGFGRELRGLCGDREDCAFMVPNHDISFLGNTTLCVDTDYANRLASNPSESDAKWWEMWLATGLLAQILIKFVLVNYGVALYRWADPLSSCGGQCLWPPIDLFGRKQESFREATTEPEETNKSTPAFWSKTLRFLQRITSGDEEQRESRIRAVKGHYFADAEQRLLSELGAENEMYLRVIARKWAFFWGLLTNLCLANLVFAIFAENEEDEFRFGDTLVRAGFVSICVLLVVLFSVCVRRSVRRRMGVSDSIPVVANEITENSGSEDTPPGEEVFS